MQDSTKNIIAIFVVFLMWGSFMFIAIDKSQERFDRIKLETAEFRETGQQPIVIPNELLWNLFATILGIVILCILTYLILAKTNTMDLVEVWMYDTKNEKIHSEDSNALR